MKRILISLMIIGIVTTVIGVGLSADYSDTEMSRGNTIETGSLDLVVTYEGEEFEDPNVPTMLSETGIMPECTDKTFEFDLHNKGEASQEGGHAYLHFKNLECYGIEKTEPELVAETGLNATGDEVPVGEKEDGSPVYVAGIGEYGENCELSKHIRVSIFVDPDAEGPAPMEEIDLSGYDENEDGHIKLDELVCYQIYLGPLPAGASMDVQVHMVLQDIPEEYFGLNYFDETIPAEAKWNDWPTNALQKDGVYFDVAFELLQFQAIEPPTP